MPDHSSKTRRPFARWMPPPFTISLCIRATASSSPSTEGDTADCGSCACRNESPNRRRGRQRSSKDSCNRLATCPRLTPTTSSLREPATSPGSLREHSPSTRPPGGRESHPGSQVVRLVWQEAHPCARRALVRRRASADLREHRRYLRSLHPEGTKKAALASRDGEISVDAYA
ncbi:hypothetical protein K437DRAFT_98958 [Tilletiaria anomala UBC 951]|uniref:Uncharacterized protein n=1 Tax=Tilletiaria anomala (strain ATCC 24038 / CBS 436.72 / UBC 951) TaxID=1037660 RepID=A0A066W991_TILAU|nr:uncharacterized protein K437DRAFT_98958 [Tilletiaria anomala UBC 951]KDN47320.1 hypothetical protein K437DRAFT_98958 [Tilletiaria anomala UBC 951]